MRLYSSALTLVASCFLQHARVTLGDNVLVMSSTNALVHDTSSTVSTFSVTGLTQFAMESFGISTSRVVKLSNVDDISSDLKNPIQSDIFKKNTAYAVVVVEGDDYVLEALETSPAVSSAGFHKVFPVASSELISYDVLYSVLANEVSSQFEGDVTVECAGNADLCASYASEEVNSDSVSALIQTLGFLDAETPEDVAFATEIFQVKQLTKALEDGVVTNAKALYIVNFASVSALAESKIAAANVVVSSQATEFLRAYLSRFGDKNCGAQVIATKQAVGMEKVGEVMSLSRLLQAIDGSSGGSAEADVGSSSGSTGDEVVDKVGGGDSVNGTDSNGFSNKADFGMTEIAEYQIVLWTSVILAVTLTMAILAMCNMNVGRDNLLYAKFIADGGHRKAD